MMRWKFVIQSADGRLAWWSALKSGLNPDDRVWAIATGALILVTCGLFFGCSTANYGSLSRNKNVAQAFENYDVFADHRYYHLNLENNPYAVIALQSGYKISDPLWRELDPNSEKFKKVIDLVAGFPVYYYPSAYGSYILDSRGNRIGYWYSSLRAVTIRVDNESQNVSINTEKPWLRDDDERFRRGSGGRIRFRF